MMQKELIHAYTIPSKKALEFVKTLPDRYKEKIDVSEFIACCSSKCAEYSHPGAGPNIFDKWKMTREIWYQCGLYLSFRWQFINGYKK